MMRKFSSLLVLAALCTTPNLAGAQTPTKAQFDSLRAEVASAVADVAAFKAALGSFTVKPKTRSEPGGSACTETPSGECQVFYSLREIRLALDPIVSAVPALTARVAAVESRAPSSGAVVVSAPTGPTIAPLSSGDVQGVVAALTNGVNAGRFATANRDRIKSELAAGTYTFFDQPLVDAIKFWYYNGASSSDQAPLYKYLQIIDQRDPDTNQPLLRGDPRVKQVYAGSGGTSFANSVSGDLYVSGRVIVGSCLHTDANAPIAACSSGDGAIHFESGVGGSKPAVGMISLGGDHGLRELQNGYTSVITHPAYDPVGKVNYQSNLIEGVDPNYPSSIIGADSQGRFSMVVKPSRNSGHFDDHEYTQDLAFGFDEASKTITLESWRPGWTFQFVTSSGFRTIDRRFTVPTQ